MRILPSLCLFGLAMIAVAACGTSNGNGTVTDDAGASPTNPAPTACVTAEDCNPDQCVCTDGETVQAPTICLQGSCAAAAHDSFCASSCKAHGGVSAIRPSPNVAASAECDAWCSKGAALACGSAKCTRFFFCAVPKHSCEAAARAALKCAADQGTWACSKSGSSWSVSSSCATFSGLCGDAG